MQPGCAREEPDPLLRGITASLMLLCLEGRQKLQLLVGLAHSPAHHLAAGLFTPATSLLFGQPHPAACADVQERHEVWGIAPESSPRLLALTRPGIAFSHRAFRKAKIPEISQSPSLPSLGSRDLPLTSYASTHIAFSCRGMGVFLDLLLIRSLPA